MVARLSLTNSLPFVKKTFTFHWITSLCSGPTSADLGPQFESTHDVQRRSDVLCSYQQQVTRCTAGRLSNRCYQTTRNVTTRTAFLVWENLLRTLVYLGFYTTFFSLNGRVRDIGSSYGICRRLRKYTHKFHRSNAISRSFGGTERPRSARSSRTVSTWQWPYSAASADETVRSRIWDFTQLVVWNEGLRHLGMDFEKSLVVYTNAFFSVVALAPTKKRINCLH